MIGLLGLLAAGMPGSVPPNTNEGVITQASQSETAASRAPASVGSATAPSRSTTSATQDELRIRFENYLSVCKDGSFKACLEAANLLDESSATESDAIRFAEASEGMCVESDRRACRLAADALIKFPSQVSLAKAFLTKGCEAGELDSCAGIQMTFNEHFTNQESEGIFKNACLAGQGFACAAILEGQYSEATRSFALDQVKSLCGGDKESIDDHATTFACGAYSNEMEKNNLLSEAEQAQLLGCKFSASSCLEGARLALKRSDTERAIHILKYMCEITAPNSSHQREHFQMACRLAADESKTPKERLWLMNHIPSDMYVGDSAGSKRLSIGEVLNRPTFPKNR